MKFGALTAALLPEFQLLPFSNKLPLIVLKLALLNMPNINLYKDAHLVVSAIRVLERRNSVPPSIDDVCNFVSFSLEEGNYICRKLNETGVIEIVEGAFGIRLFVKNHLAIEEIPKDAKVSSMEEELKKFQDSRKELTQKVASIQAQQAEKQKNLFTELENQLKKHLDKK